MYDSPKKHALLYVLFGITITIWVLSIAAANVDWYKEESSAGGVSTTIKYYLYEVRVESCFSGTCASNSQKWSDVKSFDKLAKVHTTSRILLIVGLVLNSLFWVLLILHLVKEFIPALQPIFTTKQKILRLLGYIILFVSVKLLAISFLTYIGFSGAYKDDLKAAGGTCVTGPCKGFTGSDNGDKWGPSSGFALEVVCAFLGIIATILYFLWQRSLKNAVSSVSYK